VKFGIVIIHDRRNYRLQVQRIYQSPEVDQYRVIARNGTFTLQTNSPLLRNKGLKYKKAEWKVIQGAINNRSILESIIKAIEINVDK
jgi:hypothetical protein